MTVKVWTDGSCLRNPGGPGGWAFALKTESKTAKISGHCPSTTNNRMEIKAILEALRLLKSGREVTVFSDSRYVIDGATKWITSWKRSGWVRKTKGSLGFVPNADLWAELEEQTSRLQVTFVWVKGHADNNMNNVVDKMAGDAARNKVVRDIKSR